MNAGYMVAWNLQYSNFSLFAIANSSVISCTHPNSLSKLQPRVILRFLLASVIIDLCFTNVKDNALPNKLQLLRQTLVKRNKLSDKHCTKKI